MASDSLRRMVLALLRPLQARITNMVARAVVDIVDDSPKIQLMQLVVGDDETRDELERFQEYGFTSVPDQGAEAAVVFVNGRRDHGLIVAVDDRRYRLKGLQGGEVALYDKNGTTITLKANGDVQITPHSGVVKVTGDVEATGDVKAGTISLKSHVHQAGSYSNSGGAVTGTSGSAT